MTETSQAMAGMSQPAQREQTAGKAKQAQSEDRPSAFQRDLEAIREQGFRAFAEDLEKRKLERLREKILSAMGLNEQALEEMPAEQRAAVEKIVAREIQRRLAATDAVENGGQAGPSGLEAGRDLLAMPQGAAGNLDAGTGPALLQAMQLRDAAAEEESR